MKTLICQGVKRKIPATAALSSVSAVSSTAALSSASAFSATAAVSSVTAFSASAAVSANSLSSGENTGNIGNMNGISAINFPDSLTDFHFRVKDPGSALTHFIGFIAAIIMTPVILIHASTRGYDFQALVSIAVFMISMIVLYGASTSYHSFNISESANMVLKRIDHMSIFLLIAGSYTPFCLVVLRGEAGTKLFIEVWALAVVGMLFKLFWVTCPKWLSSVIYIGMGWLCLTVLPDLVGGLERAGFYWLLAGGLLYTAGGVIYALKFKVFGGRFKYFGSHELFHCFVLAGSLCHFIVVYNYI